jgi:hypothetical protein
VCDEDNDSVRADAVPVQSLLGDNGPDEGSGKGSWVADWMAPGSPCVVPYLLRRRCAP